VAQLHDVYDDDDDDDGEFVSGPAITQFEYHNIVIYAYRFMYFRILIC